MKYDQRDAVRHVVHDYVYLVAAGTDTQRGNAHPYKAERTFLVHCRAFGEFFSHKKTSRDLRATHFTRSPFVRNAPTWDTWRGHIDKHLMHLTEGRITNTIPWDGKPNKDFLREFRAIWHDFLGALRDELRPLFDQEIEKHRKDFKDYPL
jgi:hypothetical protein